MGKKIELYIISLWFLFFLLCVSKIHIPICFDQDCHFIGLSELLKQNVLALVCIIMMLLGIIYYWRFDYTIVQGAKSLPKEVKEIENVNFETLSFLLTYLIPFVGISIDGPRTIFIFVLILALIGAIFVKTNIFYTNPTLAVLNFRVYKVTTDNLKKVIVIVRGELKVGYIIEVKEIDDNIYIAKIRKP